MEAFFVASHSLRGKVERRKKLNQESPGESEKFLTLTGNK
jgi:hypothetical protein